MTKESRAIGLDIGGSGVKAAVVDLDRGELVSERVRLKTPRPATPEAVLETAAAVCTRLDFHGDLGCGFPGTLHDGVVAAAPNLDPSWIGEDLPAGVRRGRPSKRIAVGNDADAAGLAEVRLGAGRNIAGTVLVVTLGTGIGTALFHDGRLVPNTELGHLELDGEDAERLAANSARKRNDWSFKQWAEGLDRYLAHLEYLLGVDRFVIGGGVSKKAHKFLPRLERVGCEVVPASMGNLAGIVGAALFVRENEAARG